MNDYIIFADSCCDIKPELLRKWGVSFAYMTFTFDGEEKVYTDADISNKEFYQRMRQGASPKTAAINADTFTHAFEERSTPIFISHADCEADARQLAQILKQRHGAQVTLLTEIGPVIGSHSGPGTIALFFIGKHR